MCRSVPPSRRTAIPAAAADLYKQQVAKSTKLGSVIVFPLGNGHLSYLHFIGPGIYGDAVRVLEGVYTEQLEVHEALKLSGRPERFIAQTFVGSLMAGIPGAEVVTVVETRKSWTIAPYWVSSPVPASFVDRWVVHWDVSPDGMEESRENYRMADFVEKHPEVDAPNLPETAVVGEGVLQDMVKSAWKPAYGDFGRWVRQQEA